MRVGSLIRPKNNYIKKYYTKEHREELQNMLALVVSDENERGFFSLFYLNRLIVFHNWSRIKFDKKQ